jgi:hypothetical protein
MGRVLSPFFFIEEETVPEPVESERWLGGERGVLLYAAASRQRQRDAIGRFWDGL